MSSPGPGSNLNRGSYRRLSEYFIENRYLIPLKQTYRSTLLKYLNKKRRKSKYHISRQEQQFTMKNANKELRGFISFVYMKTVSLEKYSEQTE